MHHLDPEVSESSWTKAEIAQLFSFQKDHGTRWKEIACNLPGRRDYQIKNKFYSVARRLLKVACKLSALAFSSAQIEQIKPRILAHYFRQEIPSELSSSVPGPRESINDFLFANLYDALSKPVFEIGQLLKRKIDLCVGLIMQQKYVKK